VIALVSLPALVARIVGGGVLALCEGEASFEDQILLVLNLALFVAVGQIVDYLRLVIMRAKRSETFAQLKGDLFQRNGVFVRQDCLVFC
jgi:hypothetical protein